MTTLRKASGPAAAATLAAAIGVLIIGLATTFAEVSEGLKGFLTWSQPVGPLSGKTGIGVIAWLLSWLILHGLWKGRSVNFSLVYRISLVLIGLGLLLTFPPVFEALAD